MAYPYEKPALLITMITTAIWLNGNASGSAMRWDSARWMVLFVLVTVWVAESSFSWLTVWASLYLAVNGLFLLLLGMSGKGSRSSVELA